MRSLGVALLVLLAWTRGAEAACSGSGLSWNCSAGTTVGEVNTALASAPDGATLTFAAGSYSWAQQITLSNAKGVSLVCASQGGCSVAVGGMFLYMDSLSGVNNRVYRLSGFRFANAPAGTMGIWIFGNGTLNNLRIDHNSFENFDPDSIAILLGETSSRGAIYGVIDSNSFSAPTNFMGLKLLGHGDTSNWGPSPKGTARNLYVEDNAFTFTTSGNLGAGCVDVWNSGAIVWRYNTSQNCLVTAHGVTHGGVINFELYKNNLIRTANSGSWEDGTRLFHHQGSGEFVAFDNVFTAASGKSSGPMAVTHYRSADPVSAGYNAALGRCDGTSGIDSNRAPSSTFFGYPCWRQPGRDGVQGLQPMYAWGNRWSDTNARINLTVENPWGATNPGVETHIQADRDYYNQVTSFNGSSGMGVGTLAARPASCTTNSSETGGGVGYFAIDQGPQGTLYRCSASNTWTVQYIPYTYPHPLRGGSTQSGGGTTATPPPASPTGLRVVR